ncbi:thiolase domain-containing protein [Geobacter sp.]|uniref:thiolase C-terminal domain-containing protein n=1 Tax=Geobacter sp. TaxID=46610 RepID=UPI002635107F|nr:thiolase domain-containing protein [Geobacter sp.]
MRPVYMITGGITKFAKAHPEKDFRLMVKEAFDYALADLPGLTRDQIDGSVCSYFSDHFTRQLKAGAMVQDYLGLCPKPSRRIEGGGATGGLCFQAAWEAVASGRMELCLAMGFETMSRVNTWKGNEFIALASDTNFDYPVGGFYTGYYAMMVQRHMHEFGTTTDQMAMVAVKNHANALHNPYAQKPARLTIAEVRAAPMVATPLTILDCCQMSDGAAVAVLASEEAARRLCSTPVRITGVGSGTDAMRMADRPHGAVILLPHESPEEYRELRYPGVHSFRAGRMAAKLAYGMAGIRNPAEELDFVELHDAYTSSEIQTCEDLGLCRYGEGGRFVASGAPFLPDIDYGLGFSGEGRWPRIPVNPSGGLLACGHPVGATGLMQAVFAFWQLQGSIAKHLGDATLQIPGARRGLIHSHAGTGTYITVSILERG